MALIWYIRGRNKVNLCSFQVETATVFVHMGNHYTMMDLPVDGEQIKPSPSVIAGFSCGIFKQLLLIFCIVAA